VGKNDITETVILLKCHLESTVEISFIVCVDTLMIDTTVMYLYHATDTRCFVASSPLQFHMDTFITVILAPRSQMSNLIEMK